MLKIGVVCMLLLLIVAIDADGNPCEDVTFGECNPNRHPDSIVLNRKPQQTIQLCNEECYKTNNCTNYRYNNETKECTLMTEEYRDFCDIFAGPWDKKMTDCLGQISNHICDSHREEDCEYTGELLREYPDGAIVGASNCQKLCKDQAPDCKYWIQNEPALCILKKDGRKTCKVWGGPKEPTYDQCK